MSEVNVTAEGPGAYTVTVTGEGAGETRHRVTIPHGYLDEVGVAGADPDRVIRVSFAFLLEREPASSIMSSFDLPTISRFFPEYPSELRRRFS